MAERVGLLSSSARTASVTTPTINNDEGAVALHLVVDVTAGTAGQIGLTPVINGVDPISGKTYVLLAGATILATGTTVYKIGPDYTAAAGVAKDYLPYNWNVVFTVSGGISTTFSAAASMI